MARGQETVVRWLDDAQQRHWRSFLGGVTALMARLDRDLQDLHGLSLAEYEVLVRLSEAEKRSMRMSELAEQAALSRSRLTHTVSRLEKAGILLREKCVDEDGRGVRAVLTEAGHAKLREAAHTHLNGVRDYFVDRLSPDELAVVGTKMEEIVTALHGRRF